MFGVDHMFGSFEFDTDVKQLDNGWWEASALGIKSAHRDQSQALNDLNQKLDDAIQRGELKPDGGL